MGLNALTARRIRDLQEPFSFFLAFFWGSVFFFFFFWPLLLSRPPSPSPWALPFLRPPPLPPLPGPLLSRERRKKRKKNICKTARKRKRKETEKKKWREGRKKRKRAPRAPSGGRAYSSQDPRSLISNFFLCFSWFFSALRRAQSQRAQQSAPSSSTCPWRGDATRYGSPTRRKFFARTVLWGSPRLHVVLSFVAEACRDCFGTFWTRFAAHELRHGRLRLDNDELMENGFALDEEEGHLHRGQLQLHRSHGHYLDFELHRRACLRR